MLGKVKGEYRTSNIVEPANGQLPYKDPAGVAKKQMAGFNRYVTGNAPYEGPEEPALSERCLIGFGTTGGPGMLSVLYNNNYQFVQTEGPPDDPRRDGARCAHRPDLRLGRDGQGQPQAQRHQAVAGRQRRLVGRRHAGDRDHQHQSDAVGRELLPAVAEEAS